MFVLEVSGIKKVVLQSNTWYEIDKWAGSSNWNTLFYFFKESASGDDDKEDKKKGSKNYDYDTKLNYLFR